MLERTRKMKILIVDDSKSMQKMIANSLRKAGYDGHDYVFADHGEDGLKKIEEENIDLILSDWHMPVMDGLTFIKSVKELGIKTPMGMITTERSPERVAEAKENGAMFVVSKPFTPAQLSEAILEVLDDTPDTSSGGNIILPELEDIEDILLDTLQKEAFAHHAPISARGLFPNVVGFYVNMMQEIKAVVILDRLFVNIAAGAKFGSELEAIYGHIENKTIDANAFDESSEIFEQLSHFIKETDDDHELTFRSGHFIASQVAKLDNIMNCPHNNIQSYIIEVRGYGTGRMTLVGL
jgi:two-component system, chemotaxis family, chemotaxis protein CheY